MELVLETTEGAFALDGAGQPAGDRVSGTCAAKVMEAVPGTAGNSSARWGGGVYESRLAGRRRVFRLGDGPAWPRRRAVVRRLGGLVKVLVAGASGFVGRRLCAALERAGHDVAAMTRNPARYRGPGTPVRGDVQDPAVLESAMAGCQAAYYLVHSLQDADFERKDATGATAFGEAAAGPACAASSTWVAWATTRTTCPPTYAAAVRSRACSAPAECRSPSSGPGSSSGTAASPGS